MDVVSLYLTGMHQVGAFSSFQGGKYFSTDNSTDEQHKLQSLAGPSGGLLKILVELQQ